MRVYVPMTLPGLADWSKNGVAEPVSAHAVTPGVREWYTEGDLEELEYAVLLDAARASLDLLEYDFDAPRRRVVVAVDVPDAAVGAPAYDAPSRSAVVVQVPLGADAIVSVHVDEESAVATVEAAVEALPAARLGDEDAAFALDEAEACDLLWYDASEVEGLIG
ncbi:DUF6912 family protein [Spongisporangium articulatum]|uniref:DUF6912 family protein n=1 Tax=Spongisporangium articulatum TaxID=3362603 RepID=A0ABW8AJY0_9ACTN